ncbi:hypothetical protein [Streptomyces sp. NPDC051219]|uniref:hypothetical protein n=1 Tax=Streptomyces sp. NPDC051219 TaxID=3155283 RepID=UPI003419687B
MQTIINMITCTGLFHASTASAFLHGVTLRHPRFAAAAGGSPVKPPEARAVPAPRGQVSAHTHPARSVPNDAAEDFHRNCPWP